MLQNPRKTTVEINLHGLTTADAKRKLEQFLSRLPASVTEVIVIHGYHGGAKKGYMPGGQALGNMVRQRLKHPRIRAKILCLNPGETRLLLSPPARPHSK